MDKIAHKKIAVLVLGLSLVFILSKIEDSKAVVYENIQQNIVKDTNKSPVEIKSELPAQLQAVTPPPPPARVVKPKPKPVIAPPPLAPRPVIIPPPAPQPQQNCEIGSFNQQFLCLLNDYRKSKGLNSLVYDSALNQTAESHSAWMSATNTMSHTGENGSKFNERCQQHNTSCDAENVAMGYSSAKKLFEAWKASSGHNVNMLGTHTKTGLSLVGKYTTSLFK